MGLNIETYVHIAAQTIPHSGAWRAALTIIMWMGSHSPHDVAEFQCKREMDACQRLLNNTDVISDPGLVYYVKEKWRVYQQFYQELNATQETMQVPSVPGNTGVVIQKGNRTNATDYR